MASAALLLAFAGEAGAVTPNTFLSPFQGVSCSSDTTCTAVGPGLAERWGGLLWVKQALADPSAELTGVSCPSTTECIAVGGRGAAERWDPTGWSAQVLPSPVDLNAVSCPTVTDCIAVGDNAAERWNGTSWSELTLPSTPNDSDLLGVSCTSVNACTAVGILGSIGNSAPLAERWDGTTWTVQATATPVSPDPSALTSVSCTSATSCTAVGYVNPDASTDFLQCGLPTPRCIPFIPSADVSQPLTLAESWNGQEWLLQSTAGGGGVGAFFGVSCPTSVVCEGVGAVSDASGELQTPLTNRSASGVWSYQVPAEPSGRNFSGFAGVSCTSTSACTAVGGSLRLSPFSNKTLAERWNGKRWTIQLTP
jgi:hypothetical protein